MDRRLAILKALSDNTRYAIYVELARTTVARSTQEISDELEEQEYWRQAERDLRAETAGPRFTFRMNA